ncbi:magnesium-translocating P-type ATPase [Flavobacterium sp. NKUCC04_CG]|uniref:magnesium-translocating P-type ATPase n=1 Tax=Flavobacterium sp. NKUCC04_CG TaxID=2842121 RepID=UPI001C5ACDEC|nr:magnesium-translocating P-type ATPase [Flavobacterium sp. NKUCC04_CG]MBW3518828.1 magnesium-translocating P-type ATPase [Flavobacterium sp. NKUCC04_CG]
MKTKKKKFSQEREILITSHAVDHIDECFQIFNTSEQGLSSLEAGRRLEVYGKNEIVHQKAPAVIWQLLLAYKNPFIFVLGILAIISFFMDFWLPYRQGEPTELAGCIIISTMIFISGMLRFWQEYRTNKAAESLNSLVKTTATVRRRTDTNAGGLILEVDVEELVPGDIVQLSAGDLVPADIRLFTSRDLFVSEAALTGESMPVEKFDIPGDHDVSENSESTDALHDLLRLNHICLMGTNVTSGTASGMVFSTGSETYIGSLATSIVGKRPDTAFDKGVNSVSWLLIRFMMVMVPVVFLVNGLIKGNWMDSVLFALAVAVGLTPEMLPMIVSANLAKGAINMSKRKVIVKRLNAIQNLGAMDVLCTDKTGTLTQDEIVLDRYMNLSGADDERILQWAWLNSFHQSGVKNLMDRAVVKFTEEREDFEAFTYHAKVDELPFDFERRRLSVIVNDASDNHILICKGAVEELLDIATHIRLNDEFLPMDDKVRSYILEKATAFNKSGYRVLLVGIREIPEVFTETHYTLEVEQQLTIEGFLTFLDPPKSSTKPAIQALLDNGIQVKVLTGDNVEITRKICREVGIDDTNWLVGSDIARMNAEELSEAVEKNSIFAKLSPLQKNTLLKCLQKNGHTVGFLGDGINDAPALRDADVGISVDSGTDIAKESADIILLEKDLMVLDEGILIGRQTFGNIIKYLNMTASSNFGNVFSVIVASAFIPFLPMLAIHLLLQNLIYDISQLSLPWDKMDRDFLKKPRKWDSKNIGRFMMWIGPTSSIFDITTFAVLWYIIGANSVEHQALFQSGWFVEGLLSQTLVVHLLRTQKIPFIQSTATLPVLVLTGMVMCLGLYIPFSPLGTYIGLVPLPGSYFPWLLGILLSYFVVVQTIKTIYIRRFGQWF